MKVLVTSRPFRYNRGRWIQRPKFFSRYSPFVFFCPWIKYSIPMGGPQVHSPESKYPILEIAIWFTCASRWGPNRVLFMFGTLRYWSCQSWSWPLTFGKMAKFWFFIGMAYGKDEREESFEKKFSMYLVLKIGL